MAKQKHENLAAALAAFQANLPAVAKGATGQVGNNRNYKYADLADISAAVYPTLSEHGLAFLTRPTFNAAGKFVLAFSLLHESGGREDGEFDLTGGGNMQQLGSAITYARRYALCAVTGVVPDEDDDGHAASQHWNRQQEERSAPQQRANGQQQRPAAQAPTAASNLLADEARKVLREKATGAGVDLNDLAARFEQQYGEPLKECSDHARITAFMKLQNLSSASRVAANGGAAR
jgi:hypothetical protein